MLNQIDQLFNMAATIKYLMVIVGMSHYNLLAKNKEISYAHSPNGQMELKQTKHSYVLTQKCDFMEKSDVSMCYESWNHPNPSEQYCQTLFITKYHVNKRCFPQCSIFIWNSYNHAKWHVGHVACLCLASVAENLPFALMSSILFNGQLCVTWRSSWVNDKTKLSLTTK